MSGAAAVITSTGGTVDGGEKGGGAGSVDREIREGATKTANEEGSSVAGASLNFINSIIGAGIIGLPFALRESGFMAGVPMLLIVGVTTYFSTGVIIRLGVEQRVRAYEDLAAKVFGRVGFVIVNLSNAFFAFGAMLAYLVITGDTLSVVFAHWSGSESAGHSGESSTASVDPAMRRGVIAAVATFTILPISLLRTMTALERWSGLSLFAVAIIITFVVIRAFLGPGKGALVPHTREEKTIEIITPRILPGLAVASFAFVVHHNSFLVFNSLKTPTLKAWTTTSRIAIISSIVASLLLAITAYLTFKGVTQGNVLNNYSVQDEFANVVRFLYALTMVLTYPLEMFVTRYSLYSAIFRASSSTAPTTPPPPTSSQSSSEESGVEMVDVKVDVEGKKGGDGGEDEVERVDGEAKGVLGGVWGALRRVFGDDSGTDPQDLPLVWHLGLTLGLWVVSLVIALVVDDLGVVLEITGGVAASLIGYIIPGVLLFRLSPVSVAETCRSRNPQNILLLSQAAYFVALGALAMIVTIVLTITG